MHDIPFADSTQPAAVSVLKLLMLPYSVGHELTLLVQRNPLVFLSQGDFGELSGNDQRAAIIAAADVCCQSWAEYHGRYTGWERFKIARKWRQWRRVLDRADYGEAIESWRKYRADGSLTFPMEEMPDAGAEFRYLGQPEMASLLNFLQITCRLTEEQAFDYPLGLARMRRLAWLESEGSARITNATDAEIARRREEYLKAHPEPEFVLHPKD